MTDTQRVPATPLREVEPDRARGLLEATNSFLRCEDVAALGAAVTDALVAMFAPDKAVVVVVDWTGVARMVASVGYDPSAIATIEAAMTSGASDLRQVLGGDELWSSDPGDRRFSAGLATFGGQSGFAVPMPGPDGVVGAIAALHDTPRRFDRGDRDAARSLAAQAGLTLRMITSRELLASQVVEQTRSLETAVAELRLANDAKTDFLANISHELRTPLTAILGFVEVLATGMDGPLTPSQATDVATIQSSSRHLLELIDDLIDIASIEGGRVRLQHERVDLGSLVGEAAETVRPLAGEKGIQLEIDLPARPVVTEVDLARVREIVLHLVSNAVKFTPAGGRVRVAVEAPTAGDGQAVTRIVVRDSGVGIAAEDQERIFEKFVRIADPAVPGTGLGLAVARGLARLHGGDVTLRSTVGIGSAFTVSLPLSGSVR